MKKKFIALLVFVILVFTSMVSYSQTYYYEGGKISANDLGRARAYKKGTFILQGARHRGIIWVPKHSTRGNRYLELLMEHFLQGAEEIHDFSPIQIGTLVGGSHGIASVLTLLMDLEARKLLGLTEQQGEMINGVFSEFRTQVAGRMTELHRVNPHASSLQVVLTRTAEIERLSLLLEAKLGTILSVDQLRRSKEIVFQLYGGFDTPVVDLGILALFELSRPQREKLELIAEDANQKRDKVFAGRENRQYGPDDMQAFNAAMGEVSVLVSRKIRECLTPEQLKKGDELMAHTSALKVQLGL